MGDLEDKINQVMNDPNKLGEITRMAKSLLSGDSGISEKLGGLLGSGDAGSGIDTGLLEKFAHIMSKDSGNSEKKALLEAIKPYLDEGRRNKMDKAMKIAKMAKLAEIALGEFGGE